MSREVVVVSGVRTAIGTYGGSLKDIPPTELAANVVREALSRANVEGKDVGHVVFGHVVNTEPKDMYLSRVAAIQGGCAEGTPAVCVALDCKPLFLPAKAFCWVTPMWRLVAALKT
jgi:acetyl-CoA C-acetyltransferase